MKAENHPSVNNESTKDVINIPSWVLARMIILSTDYYIYWHKTNILCADLFLRYLFLMSIFT